MSELEPSIEFGKKLESSTTPIPGLITFDLPVHGDNRGWFKENWQVEKMLQVNLPDFHPVQNNISYNDKIGTTRGIHAEPWDKYISIAKGRIFGAWVDLREGPNFGKTFTMEMDPSKGIYVPYGVGNSFQTLEEDTVYSYLVNDHWSAEARYTFLNLGDTTSAIKWPIPLSEAELSDKDIAHPQIEDVVPMKPRKILVTGANGQLGKALREDFPDAEFETRETLDISDSNLASSRNWRQYSTIINAAAYTAVDTAETPEGRIDAWKTNVEAIINLAKIATEYNVALVNISSDYVFDGSNQSHSENEPLSPLGVYGQTKAAGDSIVETVPKHYTIRTTWVIGDGNNFVKTMASLAAKDIKPSVVDDQVGRLTFTSDISKSIKHLIDTAAPYGTYNVSSDGESVSWAEIAKDVFEHAGRSRDDVTRLTTQQYYEGKENISPRPLQSTLNLDKIKAAGFAPQDMKNALKNYLEQQS